MRALAICLALAAGCQERDQWTIVIGTDAPIPQFGDRLLIEILSGSGTPACAGCRRQLSAVNRTWPVSFGVVPPPSELLVRARLYRTEVTGADGLPDGEELIDALGLLPSAHGNTRVGMRLAVRCFGSASDPAARITCDPESGEPREAALLGAIDELPSPGSWPGSRSVPCPSDPPAEMACIAGGAFLLGGSDAIFQAGQYDSRPERVARMSPFALDRDEMTVAKYKQLLREGRIVGEPRQAPADRTALFGACTYLGLDDDRNDELPLNCVSFDQALAACRALDKTLPTEAQWEWAAGNLADETPYPWRGSANPCEQADVGLGRGILDGMSEDSESTDCRVTEGGLVKDWGPTGGGGARDLTDTGVRRLGGSLSEWVLDAAAFYDDPCWTPPLPPDPRCDRARPGLEGGRSVRGGSWNGLPDGARVINRSYTSAGGREATGFRCARGF